MRHKISFNVENKSNWAFITPCSFAHDAHRQMLMTVFTLELSPLCTNEVERYSLNTNLFSDNPNSTKTYML